MQTDYSIRTIDDRSLAPRRLTHAVGGVFAAEPYQTRMIPVTLAERPHPFPSRTRKLSSPAPKILRGQPFGKIGRRRDFCVRAEARCGHTAVRRDPAILAHMTAVDPELRPSP